MDDGRSGVALPTTNTKKVTPNVRALRLAITATFVGLVASLFSRNWRTPSSGIISASIIPWYQV